MSRLFVCLAISLLLCTLSAFGALTGIAAVTAEAEGPDGAHVTFAVQVEGGNDGSDGRPADTVTCTPPSGSLFPLGMTTVSCVGSEGSTGSFVVTVVDWTAPALTLPRDFTVVTTSPSGEAVSYTATAFDLVDGSVAVTCAPPSGSTFPLGTTAVTCTASDAAGNTASDGFNITVATTPPPPGNPDIVAEATGPDGARVTFDTGDTEDDDGRPGSGGCSPAPGTMFPLGDTVVSCPSGDFTVSVVDTTPPSLDLPDDITVTADSPTGAAVAFSATASDLVDGSVAVTCTPPSGSTFPLGTTTVNCSATDSHDNTANGSFEIEVTSEPEPPENPDDITAEATGANGAIVTFDLGFDDGGRPITCSPSSGSTFPLGDTTVACSSGATFTVTVVDTTPPVLTLPPDMTVEATSAAGAPLTFTTTSFDLVDGSVPVICTPPSGSTFALGTTTVNCSATDAHDNTSSGSFSVTVVDTTPPDITSVTVTPATIWPPNKKLVNVTVTVEAEDLVDPAPIVRIYDITCDEPIGSTDAGITGLLTARLRADRLGSGDGRVYTLYIEAFDASGNRSTATVDVIVPHDQSGNETSTAPAKRRSARG
jgi:hypothetical protein